MLADFELVEYIFFINLSFTVISIIMSVIVLSGVIIIWNKDRQSARYQMYLSLINILLAAAYLQELIFQGRPGYLAHQMLRLSSFEQFLVPFLLSAILIQYLLYIVERNGYTTRLKVRAIIISMICTFPVFLNPFFHMYYYIDEANHYHRGSLFLMSQFLAAILIGVMFMAILHHKEHLASGEKAAILGYALLPSIMEIVQIFAKGLYLLELGTTISLVSMFMFMLNVQVDRRVKIEHENNEMKMTLFLSHLRPHFLYNALSSISQLCKKDPVKASQMTDLFAEYLRKNMDDIDKHELIPFELELEHVKRYIQIEQMRFGDFLKAEYDTPVSDFLIPPLMLQPLVENAIRYGIRQREDGGTVTIRTRREDKKRMIYVIDDGVGYDTSVLPDPGRSHIGLASVKGRIGWIKGATMKTESILGVGTTVTIEIPMR